MAADETHGKPDDSADADSVEPFLQASKKTRLVPTRNPTNDTAQEDTAKRAEHDARRADSPPSIDLDERKVVHRHCVRSGSLVLNDDQGVLSPSDNLAGQPVLLRDLTLHPDRLRCCGGREDEKQEHPSGNRFLRYQASARR